MNTSSSSFEEDGICRIRLDCSLTLTHNILAAEYILTFISLSAALRPERIKSQQKNLTSIFSIGFCSGLKDHRISAQQKALAVSGKHKDSLMDIQQYLERIHYAGPISPTFEVLSKLQIMHLLNVPFENLDIHNNTKIDLTNLFNKIVIRKRGGFCYELNGLFYELLKETGFAVKIVSARVYDGKKDYSPEFDHMALIVKIKDDNYLVDVGFGEFSSYPIKIELNKSTNDPRGIFRIENFNELYKVIKKKNIEGKFMPEYIFSEKERQVDEFYDMCNYHQTSNESHFMQKRICSLPTKGGRITLTGDTLKITENGEVKERKLNNEQEVQQELWNYFGIKL